MRTVRTTACLGLVAIAVALGTACGPSECDGDRIELQAYDESEVSELDCEVIEGDLIIEGRARMPNLREVTGNIEIVPRIYTTSLEFPALKTVGGDLAMVQLSGLTDLDIGKLEAVGGSLRFYETGAMPVVELPALKTVGVDLEFSATGAVRVEAAAVQSIGRALSVQSNPAMEALYLPVLSSVGEFITVQDNQELTAFNLDSLTSVGGSLQVYNNPKLPACEIDAWAEGVSATDSKLDGNDPTATCP